MKFFNSVLLGILSTIFFALIQVVLKFWLNILKNSMTLSEQIKSSIPFILIIVILGMLGFGLWIFAIQDISLGSIYWTTGLAYIAIPLLDYIFFGEKLSRIAIMGYGLISVGAILASRSEQ